MNRPIESAETIDSDFYKNQDLHQQVVEAAFGRFWHWAGAIPEASFARPVHLLPGAIDESLILITDDNEQSRCLSNVCTHRGNLVVTESGPLKNMRCGYHGRCFRMDGSFLSMPNFEDAENFPTEADNLSKINCVEAGLWNWVSLDPLMAFEQWFGPVSEQMTMLPFQDLERASSRCQTFELQANWALYCENYLEGFHVPYVHPSLKNALNLSMYRTELFEWGSLQVGHANPGDPTLPDMDNVAALYYWLFPNFMLNIYPWGVSLNIVDPVTVDRTTITFETWVWDETLLNQGAGNNLTAVEMEDEEIVLQVQQGVKSRYYNRGRYSPTQEKGTWHFHNLLRQVLDKPDL